MIKPIKFIKDIGDYAKAKLPIKKIPQTTTKAVNLNAIPTNLSGRVLIKKPGLNGFIPPKRFCTATIDNWEKSVKKGAIEYKYISKKRNGTSTTFHPKFHAKKLKTIEKPIIGLNVSNFSHPYGSVSISSKLNETISTSGLLQCNGISFVSKNKNLQTLLHLCPTVNKRDNIDLIEYILKYHGDDVEIGLIPGSYDETDKTIEFVIKTIKKLNKKAKINFYEFPQNRDRVIINNGELFCCEDMLFDATATNPLSKIAYASTK